MSASGDKPETSGIQLCIRLCRSTLIVLTLLVFAVVSELHAQTDSPPPDTSQALDSTTTDSSAILSGDTLSDTSAIIDSLHIRTGPDSSAIIAERMLDSIDAANQVDTVSAINPFRFNEYAAAMLLGAQREQNKNIGKAFYHDAGDFFRADRSFFTVDYLTTPARHTVSAFGVPGPRVTPIFDGRPLAPLEHLTEQDGQYDFNDIPTSSVSDVYTLTGPVAAFLGGQSGVGGIWLQKLRADGPRSESRLEIQKGPFGYAYTKGMISETLPNGFSYTAALGFRKTEFGSLLANDDASHQFWEIEAPYKRNWRITTSVRLYRRKANIAYKPQSLNRKFNRDRRDRDIVARVERKAGNNNSLGVEFRHQRSESGLDALSSPYSQRLDRIENGFSAIWNHRSSTKMLKVNLSASKEKLEFEVGSNERKLGDASLKALVRLGGDALTEIELPTSAVHPPRILANRSEFQSGLNSSFIFGEIAASGAGGYDVQPRVNLGFVSVAPGRSFTLALGVTPVFPRQYELDLPPEAPVTQSTVGTLEQSGNGSLTPEAQYTATAEARIGSGAKQLTLSITGGKITDGINWRTSPTSSGLLYRPINEDFTFFGATVTKRLALTSWLVWNSSAAIYNSEYDSTAQPAYSPDYNLFSGLALDFYYRPLEIHFSGYGEVTYNGEYFGYDGSLLGKQAVINYRAAFRIKDFTFNYVFENSLNAQFQAREGYDYIGRYSWYWITWNFFN